MALRLLGGLKGTKLYLSVEEGIGASMSEKLSRLKLHQDDLFIIGSASVDQLVEVARTSKAKALGIDSVSRSLFEARELRHLANVLDIDVLIATSQVNAKGEQLGRRELSHEADVVIKVNELQWEIEKSRFQPIGLKGNVLNV